MDSKNVNFSKKVSVTRKVRYLPTFIYIFFILHRNQEQSLVLALKDEGEGVDSIHCNMVRFAIFLSSGIITAMVVNLPERKLTKGTSVHWSGDRLPFLTGSYCGHKIS